ncbi:MAG: hypothetical protein WDZ49_07810 [Litorilinea sp.]
MDLNAPFFADFGVWLGLLLSLALFSLLIRDNGLARLAQHILAGALMGYIALVAWHDVLRLRVILPLVRGEDAGIWLPAGLGFVLVVAGVQRILAQPDPVDGADGAQPRPTETPPPLWARVLFSLGRIPVALLVGVGVGVGMVGALEGTFLPQYWRAAQIALDSTAPAGRLIIGLMTLVLTTGVMLHLYVAPLAGTQIGFVRQTLAGWMWIGRHALWLAAGIVFARLLAARMSLLIAQAQWLAATLGVVLTENPLARWLQSLFG